jgi:hypothetical protein
MEATSPISNVNPIPLKIEFCFENAERKNKPTKSFFEFPTFVERKAHLMQEIDDYEQEKMRHFLASADELNCNGELLMTELQQMRGRFGYERANFLERILINQVLCSWLKLKMFEMQEAHNDAKTSDLSFVLQHRQAQAQFSSAYDALLKVKKLLPEFECL